MEVQASDWIYFFTILGSTAAGYFLVRRTTAPAPAPRPVAFCTECGAPKTAPGPCPNGHAPQAGAA